MPSLTTTPPRKRNNTTLRVLEPAPRPSIIRINDIIDNLLSYLPTANVDLIHKAYIYSAKVHQGQTRLSGEPYLIHPLQVAYILSQMK